MTIECSCTEFNCEKKPHTFLTEDNYCCRHYLEDYINAVYNKGEEYEYHERENTRSCTK